MKLPAFGIFSMGPVHCSRDTQVRISANVKLKLGPMSLFIHLKIILLQCFQFLAISNIQTDPKELLCNEAMLQVKSSGHLMYST